jgi:hypothetical protein
LRAFLALKTAKALGVEVPRFPQQRADTMSCEDSKRARHRRREGALRDPLRLQHLFMLATSIS